MRLVLVVLTFVLLGSTTQAQEANITDERKYMLVAAYMLSGSWDMERGQLRFNDQLWNTTGYAQATGDADENYVTLLTALYLEAYTGNENNWLSVRWGCQIEKGTGDYACFALAGASALLKRTKLIFNGILVRGDTAYAEIQQYDSENMKGTSTRLGYFTLVPE